MDGWTWSLRLRVFRTFRTKWSFVKKINVCLTCVHFTLPFLSSFFFLIYVKNVALCGHSKEVYSSLLNNEEYIITNILYSRHPQVQCLKCKKDFICNTMSSVHFALSMYSIPLFVYRLLYLTFFFPNVRCTSIFFFCFVLFPLGNWKWLAKVDWTISGLLFSQN